MTETLQTRPIRIRVATERDMPAMIPIVNAAFAVEKFLEGARTDETRMAEMMKKGAFLVAEDGRVTASVFVELRGDHGYFGMLAVDPARQGKGLGLVDGESSGGLLPAARPATRGDCGAEPAS